MAEFSISLQGFDRLLRIASLDLGPVVRKALHEMGVVVKRHISYEGNPGLLKPVHKPIVWASEKQRRYVMALVREHGPWVRGQGFAGGGPRSENLTGSWEITDEDDYHVRVHNPVNYGPWVQSAEYQQPMHSATGWRTDEGVIQLVALSRDVERITGEAIEKALEGVR